MNMLKGLLRTPDRLKGIEKQLELSYLLDPANMWGFFLCLSQDQALGQQLYRMNHFNSPFMFSQAVAQLHDAGGTEGRHYVCACFLYGCNFFI